MTSSTVRLRAGCLFAASALAFLLPGAALADTPDCSTISGGAPIIYGAGASGPRDLIGAMAVQMENAADPIYVVYQSNGSCTGVYAMNGISAPTVTGTAYYWPADTGTKTTCNLSLAGDAVDFAAMDVSGLNCPLIGGDPSYLADLTEVSGPVDPVEALVPVGSSQTVISSEAFYLVYGFGAAAGIEPWTNPDPVYLQRRDSDSGTQAMISLASGLPVGSYQGTDATGGSTLVSNLAALADPEAGLGFATANTADPHRDVVRALAWQQSGQDVGYWPDSDATSFDKANVRDGLYNVWANIKFYGYEGVGAGTWADPDVQVLGEYMAGTADPVGAEKTATEVATLQKVVPVCAMHVARDTDLGPLYAVEQDEPCDCYFEYTNTGATTCNACDDSTPCSGSDVCRLGFCEAR